MATEKKEDQDLSEIEEANENLLKILSELANVISMEEKYRDAGIGMKNNETLSKLIERMNKLRLNTEQGPIET
ncbi:hypothetical protein [Sulfuricurvum sp.]|uniref:hypothetical protein n=1 Tax=Sulfuricurvum sp. TaxID=2025608 RepID=UPI003BAFEE22